MSSFWSSAATMAGGSPFAVTGNGPAPGGSAAAKFQSILESNGRPNQTESPMGLSRAANFPVDRTSPQASSGGTSGSSGSSNSDASISANDFLTLLVTEMQNQDPTADTDPNAYIDQLVQINSLEQLISINQNLSAVLSAAAPPASGTQEKNLAGVPAEAKMTPSHAAGTQGRGLNARASAASGSETAGPRFSRGNLSAPAEVPGARKVASALNGQARGAGHGHGIRDIPTRSHP